MTVRARMVALYKFARSTARRLPDPLHRSLRWVYLYLTGRRPYKALIPVQKLLMGVENSMRPIWFAELIGNPMFTSTLISESPHVRLLQQYQREGEALLEQQRLEQTEYVQYARRCFQASGYYHGDNPALFHELARHFIGEFAKDLSEPSRVKHFAPIEVIQAYRSSYYMLVNGYHRAVRAYMQNVPMLPAIVLGTEKTFMQQRLLNSQWNGKGIEIYQPLHQLPEIQDEWVLVRKCTDRAGHMLRFLKERQLLPPATGTYLDIACNIGFFVETMQQQGFTAYGLDRDRASLDIAQWARNIPQDQLIHMDIPGFLEKTDQRFDVVSALSILHHYINNPQVTSHDPVRIIQGIDRITGKVLFFETGEDREEFNKIRLKGWTKESIPAWIKQHTSFKTVIPLGTDNDNTGRYASLFGRTLFACIRE